MFSPNRIDLNISFVMLIKYLLHINGTQSPPINKWMMINYNTDWVLYFLSHWINEYETSQRSV